MTPTEKAIQENFMRDIMKMPHIVNKTDFDKYTLAFCRGVQWMKEQMDKELEGFASNFQTSLNPLK